MTPDHGVVVNLGDIVSNVREATSIFPHDAKYIGLEHLGEGTGRLLGTGNAQTLTSAKFRFRRGDVLFGKLRPYLRKTWLATFSGICSTDILVLRPSDKIIPEYLHLLVQSDSFAQYAVSSSEGTKMPRTSWSKLAPCSVVLPPLAEQRRIAEILGSMDDLIDIERNEIQHIHRLKWHVAGKAFAEHSHLGLTTIGALADVSTGGTPSRAKPDYFKGHIPWVTTTEIKYNTITKTAEMISEEALRQSPAKLYPKGTLLLAMYGQGATRGRVAMLGVDAAINQACAAIRPRPSASGWYIYFWLELEYDVIRALGHGSNQSNLNLELVRSIPIPNVDLSSQQRIVNILSVLDGRIAKLDERLALIKQLKTGLLSEFIQHPNLMEGVES